MYKNFEEIINIVKENSCEEELNRINEEIELFKERGWEKYILLGINIISKLKETNELFHLEKSFRDSYLVYKIFNLNEKDSEFLRKARFKEVLFNDALKMDLSFIYLYRLGNKDPNILKDIIFLCIKDSGIEYILESNHRDVYSNSGMIDLYVLGEKELIFDSLEKYEKNDLDLKHFYIRVIARNGI